MSLKKSTYDVIRYGGDEFVVIFSKDINEIHESVLKKKLKAKDTMFRTSFSIGVSAYNTEHELNNKLELADKTCT
ncbi:MAG TPA: diguanylate cyclase [Sulfurimonas sp.]|nr:diguanylate cyclase [Sulfurimonas sp.]HIM76113.1 diguanylate cyclase [Campylobacterales bacterium]